MELSQSQLVLLLYLLFLQKNLYNFLSLIFYKCRNTPNNSNFSNFRNSNRKILLAYFFKLYPMKRCERKNQIFTVTPSHSLTQYMFRRCILIRRAINSYLGSFPSI